MAERKGANTKDWRLHLARGSLLATRDPETGGIMLPQSSGINGNYTRKYTFPKNTNPNETPTPTPDLIAK